MKKTRVLIALFLVVSMILAFAACGGPAASPANSPSATDTPAGSPTPAPSAAPDETPVTITICQAYQAEQNAVIDDAIKEFENQYPYITVVNDNEANASDYYTVLNTKLQSNTPPDIFFGWPGSSMIPYLSAGYAMDLSGQPWVSDILPGCINEVTYQGKVMSFPTQLSFMALGYNQQVLDQLGGALPTTYDEMTALFDKALAAGILPVASGSDLYYLFSVGAVTDIYAKNPNFDQDVNSGKITLDGSADWVNLLQHIYVDWVDKGYVPKDCLGIDRSTTMLTEFVSNRALFFPMGSWDLPSILAVAPSGFQMGIIPYPGATADQTGVLVATNDCLSVNAQSPNKDAALLFLNWFAGKDVNKRFCEAGQSLSSYKDVTPDISPFLQTFIPYVAKDPAHPFVNTGWPSQLMNDFGDLTDAIVLKASTPQEIAAQMQDEWIANMGS